METALIIALGIAALIATGYYFSASGRKPEDNDMIGGVGDDDKDSESRPINQ